MAALLIAVPDVCSALVMTETVGFYFASSPTIELNEDLGDDLSFEGEGTGSASQQFSQFDPSLGTLTDINVILSGYRAGVGHFLADAAFDTDILITSGFALRLNGGTLGIDYNFQDYSFDDLDVSQNFSGDESISIDANGIVDSIMDEFIGTGMMSLDFIGTTRLIIDSGPFAGLDLSYLDTWTGGVSIEYVYDSVRVAEPSTIALMVIGLAGLGVARRRHSAGA